VKIECVILAAGSATRFGAPKALAMFKNKPLLQHAIDAATASICANVHVVTGANQSLIAKKIELERVNIISNAHFLEGMASSIVCAVAALRSADAILFMATDQPLVSTDHLNALCHCFIQNKGTTVAAAFADTYGIPAILPARLFSQLLKLRGDRGAKSVLRNNDLKSIAIPEAEFDIDTPQDLLELAKR